MFWIFLYVLITLIIYFKLNDLNRKHTLINLFRDYNIGNLLIKNNEKIILNKEQLNIFNEISDSTSHYFITGKAGTGKSQLLKYYYSNSNKKIVKLAPTGIAAININGQTLHSFFNFNTSLKNKRPSISLEKTAIIKNLEVIIIDEISMVSSDLMDKMDILLRSIRSKNTPFGGMQLIMFGDLFQLPPVVNNRQIYIYLREKHNGIFFYNAHVWNNTKINLRELMTVHRQIDNKFIEILNAIRVGNIDQSMLKHLNQRVFKDIPKHGVITLTTTNREVNRINGTRLLNIKTKEYQYHASITGKYDPRYYLVDKVLSLKAGAQIMFLKNDKNKRWVNGGIGMIKELSANKIKVEYRSNYYFVEKERWTKTNFTYNDITRNIEQEVIGTITQYPLKLAWAVTIHKSQGQTFSKCIIDLRNGVSTNGQTYVALSRCKSIAGLYLKSLVLSSDIQASNEVKRYLQDKM